MNILSVFSLGRVFKLKILDFQYSQALKALNSKFNSFHLIY